MRALAVVLVLLSLACSKKPEPAKVGTDVGDINADTQNLQEASAAVNEVLRLADDCEAARPLFGEARRKLEEAGRNVRTTVGTVSLDALRSQLANVERNCP